jgi:DNA-binding winged helix-turn-helix (wHTH) protein/alpha-beta hydrolase superfamily lysophospholipase
MQIYLFGDFRLDVAERRLTRDGENVPLRPKVFDTLVELVRNAGRLVDKAALFQAVWPETVVEEGNLAHNVSILRKALGEGKTDQEYIETVPKRGYRFVAQVAVEGDGARPAPTAVATEAQALPEQRIAFTVTADGVRIAYATSGEGPPLVKAANWLNHLEFDWRSPVWHHVMRELSTGRMLVRYDERGNGLSDWGAEDLSFEAFVTDLEAVVDAVGLDRFPLLGISQGCAVSIAYAVRHPERVTRMVLHGGYAKGWRLRGGEELSGWREGLVEMIRHGWGRDVPGFRQIFASIYIPDATPEQTQWWTDLQRVTASPENAARLLETLGRIDVVDLLPKVSVPTLVTHSRGDAGIPFFAGKALAQGIPGARFLPLESDNHLILAHEPAWPIWRSAVRGFLADSG